MAHWIILLIVMVARPMPEPCKAVWPPFDWRTKIYTAALDRPSHPAARPQRPCVLVSA